MWEEFKELEAMLLEIGEDVEKFVHNHNKSAGRRSSAQLGEISKRLWTLKKNIIKERKKY